MEQRFCEICGNVLSTDDVDLFATRGRYICKDCQAAREKEQENKSEPEEIMDSMATQEIRKREMEPPESMVGQVTQAMSSDDFQPPDPMEFQVTQEIRKSEKIMGSPLDDFLTQEINRSELVSGPPAEDLVTQEIRKKGKEPDEDMDLMPTQELRKKPAKPTPALGRTQFRCPFCDTLLSIKNVKTKSKLKCPKCKTTLYVFPDGKVVPMDRYKTKKVASKTRAGKVPGKEKVTREAKKKPAKLKKPHEPPRGPSGTLPPLPNRALGTLDLVPVPPRGPSGILPPESKPGKKPVGQAFQPVDPKEKSKLPPPHFKPPVPPREPSGTLPVNFDGTLDMEAVPSMSSKTPEEKLKRTTTPKPLRTPTPPRGPSGTLPSSEPVIKKKSSSVLGTPESLELAEKKTVKKKVPDYVHSKTYNPAGVLADLKEIMESPAYRESTERRRGALTASLVSTTLVVVPLLVLFVLLNICASIGPIQPSGQAEIMSELGGKAARGVHELNTRTLKLGNAGKDAPRPSE